MGKREFRDVEVMNPPLFGEHRLQQELQATQASLELERQHVFTFQREIRALQSELSSSQAAWKEEKESFEVKLQKAHGE